MKFKFIDMLTEPEQKFIKMYSSEPQIKETPMNASTVLMSKLNYYVQTRDDNGNNAKKSMVPGQMMYGLDPVVGVREFDLVIEDTAGKGIISLTFSPLGAFYYWYSPESVHRIIGYIFRDAFTSSPVGERLRVCDIYAALIAAEVECVKRGLIANHYGSGHNEDAYIPRPSWKGWKDLSNPGVNPTPPFWGHGSGSVPPQKGDGGTRAILLRDQLSRIIGEVSDSATDGDITKEVDGFIQDNNQRYSDWENAKNSIDRLADMIINELEVAPNKSGNDGIIDTAIKLLRTNVKEQDDRWEEISKIENDLLVDRLSIQDREADLNKRESVMSDKLNEATGNAILFSHIISTIAGKLDRIAPSGIGKMDYTPRSIVTDATIDRDQSLRSVALIEEQLGKAKWWKRAGVSAFAMGIAACIYSFAVYPTISAWINSQ